MISQTKIVAQSQPLGTSNPQKISSPHAIKSSQPILAQPAHKHAPLQQLGKVIGVAAIAATLAFGGAFS